MSRSCQVDQSQQVLSKPITDGKRNNQSKTPLPPRTGSDITVVEKLGMGAGPDNDIGNEMLAGNWGAVAAIGLSEFDVSGLLGNGF